MNSSDQTINTGAIITQVLSYLIPIVLAALAAIIGTAIRRLTPWIEAKLEASLSADQMRTAAAVVRQVVNMVEQVWHREDVQAAFSGKKEMAEQYADHILAQQGITMGHVELESMIEAAVRTELNKGPANSAGGGVGIPTVAFTPLVSAMEVQMQDGDMHPQLTKVNSYKARRQGVGLGGAVEEVGEDALQTTPEPPSGTTSPAAGIGA